jgi:cysteinyl-tRNA synthetase
MLQLHDTATGRARELALRDAGKVSMYVCGATVYAPPHIGHGRFVLVYDILRRYLEYRGLVVDHVSNVTDVDDKIIVRANDEGRSSAEVAEEFEASWWEAMDAVGALRPTAIPHATEHIDGMVELVGELVKQDVAYETSDGVYLAVERVPGYGLLAHQTLESLRAGARVDVIEEKRSPSDFAIWKKAKPGEPTWDSPFGPGRPGWHTECVVMALGLLGEGFDLHGAGQDLIFPHNENERAQAVALGRDFANHWMHNGMVEVGGQKMGKSLGNFLTMDEFLSSSDPRAYRMLVARSHYRTPIEVGPEMVADAERQLERLDNFGRLMADLERDLRTGDGAGAGASDAAAAAAERLAGLEARFVELMDDDLRTPDALATLFSAITEVNTAAGEREGQHARSLGSAVLRLFGVLGLEPPGDGEPVDSDAAELVRRLDEARAGRDFAGADAIRAQLQGQGWTVETTQQGTRIYR